MIQFIHRWLFDILWLSWALYWVVSARDVKPVERMESAVSRRLHTLPLLAAMLLLWLPRVPLPGLELRLWPRAEWQFWTGAALTLAGVLFTVWARRQLGRD